jgi:hypothetical protein
MAPLLPHQILLLLPGEQLRHLLLLLLALLHHLLLITSPPSAPFPTATSTNLPLRAFLLHHRP